MYTTEFCPNCGCAMVIELIEECDYEAIATDLSDQAVYIADEVTHYCECCDTILTVEFA